MGRRSEIEERLDQLAKLLGTAPTPSSSRPATPPRCATLKADIIARVERVPVGLARGRGDGRRAEGRRGTGLVDFYGHVDGKAVWLCWKYGEDAVTHYHGLNEGFAGRKPIEPTMRQRHLN